MNTFVSVASTETAMDWELPEVNLNLLTLTPTLTLTLVSIPLA